MGCRNSKDITTVLATLPKGQHLNPKQHPRERIQLEEK